MNSFLRKSVLIPTVCAVGLMTGGLSVPAMAAVPATHAVAGAAASNHHTFAKPVVHVKAGDKQVTVTWGKVKHATHYVVQISQHADFSHPYTGPAQTSTHKTLTKLTDGRKFYIRVFAEAKGYARVASKTVTATPHAAVNPTPQPTPTPTPTPAPAPVGNLPGNEPQGATLGTGIYAVNGFTQGTAGALFSGVLQGAGISKTIIRLTPNSMTQNAPTNQESTGVASPTNPYYILRSTTGMSSIKNLTVEGTDQGYLANGNKAKTYNGVQFSNVANPVIDNVKIVGVPGWSNQNPGETFAVGTNHANNPVFSNLEIDGANEGGSGIGLNNSTGGTLNNIYAHGLKYGNGIALWQITGNVTINNYRASNNHSAISIERVNGTVTLNNPMFSGNVVHEVNIGNDQGDTKLVFNFMSNPTSKIRVGGIGGKEQGNPNLVRQSDVKLYVNGVDKTSEYVTF